MNTEIEKYWKTNDWNHIIVRKNNNKEYSCFINGQKVVNTTGDYWTHDTYLSIGCRIAGDTPGRHLNGLVDDFRLYYSYLTDDEIQELYNCGGRISNLGDALTGSFGEDENLDRVKVNKNHSIDAKKINEPILPSEYQQLEYIESNNRQYINTEHIITSLDFTYELDMMHINTNKSEFDTFIGFMSATNSNTPRVGLHHLNKTFMFGANTTTYTTISSISDERMILKGEFKSGN